MSIVVPTFRTGPALQRVLDSLDAVDLPEGGFEVLFVDDGSGDDTVARLESWAATRPHVTVLQEANSGWPSRPRNIAIERARGEYVLFMDHDDALYPGGLERALEFARQHDSDVVSPKESKTNDVWWGSDSLSAGNLADVRAGHDIARMHEMIPHKLYRRQLLLDHGIRFPERRRALWEDWFVNVSAYRHARTVSVLADTPVYLWHASDDNTSHTFDPAREDFWDRLDELFEHLITTLDGEAFAVERAEVVRHNIEKRAVHRLARMLTWPTRATDEAERRAFDRSRALIERYGTPELLAAMPLRYRALAHLITTGTLEQVRAFQLADESLAAGVAARELAWDGDVLTLAITSTLRATRPDLATLRAGDGHVRLDPGPELSRVVPPELLAYGTEQPHTDVAVRDRHRYITWPLPTEVGQAGLVDGALVQHGSARLDVTSAACGAPLPAAVWDVRMRWQWCGVERRGAAAYSGPTVPALRNSLPVTSYANQAGNLSIDSSQHLRTLAVDGIPAPGPAGPVQAFVARLTALSALTALSGATGRVDAQLAVVPLDTVVADDGLDAAAAEHRFDAEVVADARGARLTGVADLGTGDYRLYARREGRLRRTAYVLSVDPAGGVHVVRER